MASVEPRRPVYWVPDKLIHKCKICHVEFGYMNRKHHCRHCGHIFCGSCASNFGSIPSFLPKTLHYSDVGTQVRLCATCIVDIRVAKRSRKLVEIISFLPLSFADMEPLFTVSKRWSQAIKHIVSVIKGIPCKIVYEPFTKIEKRLIKNHWKSFVGHSKYMLQTVRCLTGIVSQDVMSSIVRYFKTKKKYIHCNHLLCNTNECTETLGIFDVVEILYGFPGPQLLENPEAEVWIGSVLAKENIDWLCILIPYLVTIGTTVPCQRLINNYLLPRVTENENFLYKFYYECRLSKNSNVHLEDFYISLMERVKQMISAEDRENLSTTDKFIFYMENPSVEKQEKVDALGPIKMPYNPSLVVEKIHLDKMTQSNSFTKPYIVPLTTNVGDKKILIKKEDLRKDRLVVIIEYILNQCIPNVLLVPYNVFPIHGSYGYIEMLQHVRTVYDIEDETSIQNYILEQNPEKNIISLRKKWIQTTASNCLLTYMLGIGDRNLHNILIRGQDAVMIHIDFSYMLGDDPKYENSEMKITKGMLDMLGGMNSDGYNSLKHFVASAFSKVREKSNFWFILLSYLGKTNPYNTLADIRKFHEERLMSNCNDDECYIRITDVINRNSNGSWKQYISEYSHGITTSVKNFLFDLEL